VPAGERLAGVLAAISVNELSLPVVTNVEAAPNQDAARVRDLLVRQVSAPVRWQESIACMASLGVDRYIEIGPGKVLSGLVKRMAKGSTIDNVQDAADVSALAG
jgi:[acyl-carrier-protein] S-malonyltransferase